MRGSPATLRRPGRLLLLAAAVAGCTAAGGAPALSDNASRATSSDGALAVSAAGTILNRYAALAADALPGDLTLTVDTAASLGLAPGDLVLVMQMQGAVIDSSNAAGYGRVSARAGAGEYEIVQVGGVTGNVVAIDAGCVGLTRGYRADAATQLVRVPRFTTLDVLPGASVVAPPWDGRVGGVVALDVAEKFALAGTVDVSSAGFRGGVRDNVSANSGTADQEYRSSLGADGGEKGESIAGPGTIYDARFAGRYGRGAPANGGGGGTSHNGGGGGGANGDSGTGWSGDGVMDPATLGAAAWALDPAWARIGGRLTTSAGGGRGGYTFSFADRDALVVPPGDASWAGNLRRERGGHGGRPLKNDPGTALFLGGGGGAGDSNNDSGGSGGAGGGLVLLIADQIRGPGSIAANGGAGENTRNAGNDAPGGGGGGGTVVVVANLTSGLSIAANGGPGGQQAITTLEAEGPGGGGGGGYIAVAGGAPARVAVGGSNGTTNSASLVEFPANGATRGADGQPLGIAVPELLPVCRVSTVLPPGYAVAGSGGCDAAGGRAGAGVVATLFGLLALAFFRSRRAA